MVYFCFQIVLWNQPRTFDWCLERKPTCDFGMFVSVWQNPSKFLPLPFIACSCGVSKRIVARGIGEFSDGFALLHMGEIFE